MEDDKIKEIFNEFNPELSSSFQFMTKLQKNMEAVEIVMQHNKALQKRNKVAVAIAGVCGFAVGIILTLLFPYISEWIASFKISIPFFSAGTLNIDFHNLGWLLVAVASVLTSLTTYEVALSRFSVKLAK